MAGKLAQEIKQGRPLPLEEEAVLSVWRTARLLEQMVHEVLKDSGLTLTQYNVLRILRGAGSAGLACSQIAERMITSDPDVTRLLDRLEKSGLVSRDRSKADRRVVIAGITQEALELIAKIDKPLLRRIQTIMGKVESSSLTRLIGILEDVRAAIA